MNRPKALQVLREEWINCQRCGLAETRNLVVFGEGNPEADILIVGETPGAHEDRTGMPFVGPAGDILAKFLDLARLDPARDIFVTNVVACRPTAKVPDDEGILHIENRKPSKAEKEGCRDRLMETIYIVDPLLIITLGGLATQALCGKVGSSITKTRGIMQTFHLQGRHTEIRYPVLPMLHPIHLDRTVNYSEDGDWIKTAQDFALACDVIDHLRKIYRGIDPPDRTMSNEED